MDIAKVYFIIGYYLRLKKAIIIFVLYKKGKADYLLLGSYRPIALENTLNRILEKVIVDYITDIRGLRSCALTTQIARTP